MNQAPPGVAAAVQVRGLRYEVADRTILSDIDLDLSIGSSTALVGPSGSGKTTALMCLAGLIQPTSGTIRIGNIDMTATRSEKRAAARLKMIGIIYQFGELLPELTPLENVALPALLARMPREQAYERARELLRELGLAKISEGSTATVSGGERQRIATARALVTNPSLLLADEPTGALDQKSGELVSELLYSLPERFGCTLLVVTHNEKVARKADRCVSISDGVLAEVTW